MSRRPAQPVETSMGSLGPDDWRPPPVYTTAWPEFDLPTVRLGPVRLHAITEAVCVEIILERLRAGYGGWVVTANLDHLRLFARQPWYAALCSRAHLMVADGMPLVWASRLQGTPLPERVAGSNLILSLSAAAARQKRSIFLLGGKPGTAEAAATILCQRHPALRVVGTFCPEPGFETDPQEVARLTAAVCAAAPDIVYVGLGKPKQDQLIDHLCRTLPNAWYVGVGCSFSFVCGEVPRASWWMQRVGLEWLHRLFQEPRRLMPRYLVHGMPFAVLLLGRAAIGRLFRGHLQRKRPYA